MDVGSGTGILSLFCARAGARKVFSIEASKMAQHARDIVEKNGMKDKVQVIEKKVEDLTLEDIGGKVDIIISEWMGFYLLNEAMLDRLENLLHFLFSSHFFLFSFVVFWMLETSLFGFFFPSHHFFFRFLKEGGLLFPSKASIRVAPVSMDVFWKEHFGFWYLFLLLIIFSLMLS